MAETTSDSNSVRVERVEPLHGRWELLAHSCVLRKHRFRARPPENWVPSSGGTSLELALFIDAGEEPSYVLCIGVVTSEEVSENR